MHEDKARIILEQILADNASNHYEGIDRSEAAIAKRRERMRMASDPNSKFGHQREGFGLELEQHIINGNLTSEQSIPVLMAWYGLK